MGGRRTFGSVGKIQNKKTNFDRTDFDLTEKLENLKLETVGQKHRRPRNAAV